LFKLKYLEKAKKEFFFQKISIFCLKKISKVFKIFLINFIAQIPKKFEKKSKKHFFKLKKKVSRYS
jgi:hypothetical protein